MDDMHSHSCARARDERVDDAMKLPPSLPLSNCEPFPHLHVVVVNRDIGLSPSFSPSLCVGMPDVLALSLRKLPL